MTSPKPEHPFNLGRLGWMVDAPLFIDPVLVDRIFDAILCPPSIVTVTTKTQLEDSSKGSESEVGGSLSAEPPEWVQWIGTKLRLELNARSKTSRQKRLTTGADSTHTVIHNTERRLYSLVIDYLKNYPDRLLYADLPGGEYRNNKGRLDSRQIERLLDTWPRPLVFLDISRKTPLFPTMVELETGGLIPVHKDLDAEFLKDVTEVVKYSEDPEERKRYWAAINSKYSSREAMRILEDACNNGRIGWIDYRLLVNENGETSHLHLVPSGRYHTGTFAYNLIHRGWKYGCRIVGTLKYGNDINVLAVYER